MLSKKAQYALKALEYLAMHPAAGRPVLISEISEQQHIPLKFLENILLELRKAGILESKKGKGGGYTIPPQAYTTSIAQVLRVVDGPIAMLPCVSLHFYTACDHCPTKNCAIQSIFADARDAVLSVLEQRTIADLHPKSSPE